MSPAATARRFVRTFQPRFARLVETGAKLQTVRSTPKRMPRAGDILDAREWSGRPYASPQHRLGTTPITHVHAVSIDHDTLSIDGTTKDAATRDYFARADGFESWDDLVAWFTATHALPFEGILICWNEPPTPPTS